MTFTYSFPFPFLFKKRLIILGLKYLFISYHDYILRRVENPYHIFFLLFMYFDLFYILETKLHFIYTMLPGVRILSDYFFCELTWNFSITTGLSIKASSFLLRMQAVIYCNMYCKFLPSCDLVMHLLFISWKLASISSMSASSRFILFLFLCCSTSR